jgi:hypothetical protein
LWEVELVLPLAVWLAQYGVGFFPKNLPYSITTKYLKGFM